MPYSNEELERLLGEEPGVLSEFGSGWAETALPSTTASDYWRGPVEAITHPIDSAGLLLGSMWEGHKDQFNKARETFGEGVEAAGRGDYLGSLGLAGQTVGHGLGALVPLVGPAAANAGENIGGANTSRGLGQAAGLMMDPFVLFGAARKVAGAAGDVRAPKGEGFKYDATTDIGKKFEKGEDAYYVEQRLQEAQEALAAAEGAGSKIPKKGGVELVPAGDGTFWAIVRGEGGIRAAAQVDPKVHPSADALIRPDQPAGVNILHIVGDPGSEATSLLKNHLYALNPTASGPRSPSFLRSIEKWKKGQEIKGKKIGEVGGDPDITSGAGNAPPLGKYDLQEPLKMGEIDDALAPLTAHIPGASKPVLASPGGLAMEGAPKDPGLQPLQASDLPPEASRVGGTNPPPVDGGPRGLFLVGGDGPITPVETAIQSYLKKVGVQKPFTTSHQTLEHLLKSKSIDEIAQDITKREGVPVTREMLFDGLLAGSEAGRALQMVKESSGLMQEALMRAEKEPGVKKALDSLMESIGALKDRESTLARGTDAFFTLERRAKALYQAMLSGTIGVSAGNFANGTLNLSLDTLGAVMEGAVAKTLGKDQASKAAFARARTYAPGVVKSISNFFGDWASMVTGGKTQTKAHQEITMGMKPLIEEIAPRRARDLYHFHSSELSVAGGLREVKDLPNFDKAIHLLIAPNLIQDSFIRNAYMQAELAGLASKHDIPMKALMADGKMNLYEAMQSYAKANKKFAGELTDTISYGAMEALRATGGLRAPRGTVTRMMVDLWSKIPGLWTVMPFMNWPLANALPAVLEHIPGTVFLDKLMSKPNGVFEVDAKGSKTGPAISGTRAHRSMLEPEVRQKTESLKKAYERGKGEVGASKEQDMATLLAGKKSKMGETTLKKWEDEGLYKPERLMARQAMGAMVMATFAAWRYFRGDDGTEYNQVKSEEDFARDIHGPIGPYAPFALVGDIIGHKALGSGKYDTPEGKVRWAEMLEAMGARTGDSALASVALQGQADLDTLDRFWTRAGSSFLRGMTSGSWLGEVPRTIASTFNPEEQLGRRQDLAMTQGVQQNIPFFEFGRKGLPLSVEKTTGEPRRLTEGGQLDPLKRMLLGAPKENNAIQQFLNANKGWVSGRDVLFRNSDSPEYDLFVGEVLSEKFDERVIPMLNDPEFKKMDRESRVREFKREMQTLREQAHAAAVWENLRTGKPPLPRKMGQEAEEKVRGEEWRMENPPFMGPAGPESPEKPDPRMLLQMGEFMGGLNR